MGETASAFELMHFVEKCLSIKSACSPFFSEASPVCLLEVVQLAWTLAFPDFETFLFVRSNIPQKLLLPFLTFLVILPRFPQVLAWVLPSPPHFVAMPRCSFYQKQCPYLYRKQKLHNFFEVHLVTPTQLLTITAVEQPYLLACVLCILRDAYIYIDIYQKSYIRANYWAVQIHFSRIQSVQGEQKKSRKTF